MTNLEVKENKEVSLKDEILNDLKALKEISDEETTDVVDSMKDFIESFYKSKDILIIRNPWFGKERFVSYDTLSRDNFDHPPKHLQWAADHPNYAFIMIDMTQRDKPAMRWVGSYQNVEELASGDNAVYLDWLDEIVNFTDKLYYPSKRLSEKEQNIDLGKTLMSSAKNINSFRNNMRWFVNLKPNPSLSNKQRRKVEEIIKQGKADKLPKSYYLPTYTVVLADGANYEKRMSHKQYEMAKRWEFVPSLGGVEMDPMNFAVDIDPSQAYDLLAQDPRDAYNKLNNMQLLASK